MNGQELLIYVDGKEIGTTTSTELTPTLQKISDDWIEKGTLHTLNLDDLIDYNDRREFFEYYMRRGNTYYFRNDIGKLSFNAEGVPKMLKDNDVVLKYGESYEFNYTISR